MLKQTCAYKHGGNLPFALFVLFLSLLAEHRENIKLNLLIKIKTPWITLAVFVWCPVLIKPHNFTISRSFCLLPVTLSLPVITGILLFSLFTWKRSFVLFPTMFPLLSDLRELPTVYLLLLNSLLFVPTLSSWPPALPEADYHPRNSFSWRCFLACSQRIVEFLFIIFEPYKSVLRSLDLCTTTEAEMTFLHCRLLRVLASNHQNSNSYYTNQNFISV